MNDKEKVWKKISGDEMKIKRALLENSPPQYSGISIAIAKLKEVFDKNYTLVGLITVIDPNTFQPSVAFHIMSKAGGMISVQGDMYTDGIVFREDPRAILEEEKVRELRT